MSLPNNRRQQIFEYMLEKIGKHEDVVKKTVNTFNISSTTVYKYLQLLISDNIIERKSRGKYMLVENHLAFFYTNDNLEEDVVFNRDIRPILNAQNLPDNVMNIWYYAFTEMFNNAIEHSNAKNIRCSVFISHSEITILITDDGVGIFDKIKNYYNYNSLDDAILELFKGKLTTDSANHSGEGIFFTSRLMDNFAAISKQKYFSHDNHYEFLETLDDNDLLTKITANSGTVILMSLANRSHKQIREVLNMFADVDNGFNKTSIPMKNVFGNNFPVSRSQAKRLYNRFDKFKEVELDFKDVDEVGQAFCHELFVKFTNNYPNVQITIVNANDNVLNMINHIKNTL